MYGEYTFESAFQLLIFILINTTSDSKLMCDNLYNIRIYLSITLKMVQV